MWVLLKEAARDWCQPGLEGSGTMVGVLNTPNLVCPSLDYYIGHIAPYHLVKTLPSPMCVLQTLHYVCSTKYLI